MKASTTKVSNSIQRCVACLVLLKPAAVKDVLVSSSVFEISSTNALYVSIFLVRHDLQSFHMQCSSGAYQELHKICMTA